MLVQKNKGFFLYEGAVLSQNVSIGYGSIIYPNVHIGDNSHIGPYCIIGEPKAAYYEIEDKDSYSFNQTFIGSNSNIRSHSIIYEDVNVGDNLLTGHHVTIREETAIGNNCRVGTSTDIQNKVTIGNYVSVHSNVFIGQMTIIEDFVWIYPHVVITNDPYPPIGKLKGSIIKQFAQIAAYSVVMPGVEIGENALIGAFTCVRKDVPPERVIIGNPGIDKCSVRDIRDSEGNQVYPWKDFLKDYRGYPWQKKI